jgi:hypothetical protein
MGTKFITDSTLMIITELAVIERNKEYYMLSDGKQRMLRRKYCNIHDTHEQAFAYLENIMQRRIEIMEREIEAVRKRGVKTRFLSAK